MNDNVIITEFTDPVCTWCWGSEPVLRKLEYRYGDRVEVNFIMGGLVKDITAFYDSHNDIGGDPARSNQQIARHWLEASERHGMPVRTEGFTLFTREHPSTYPQNVAYKAAQMQDETLARRFLRRIREASAAEAKQTNTTEVLVELASEVGLDVAAFLSDFTRGRAQAAFEEDLFTTSQFRANGFPSFLVEYKGKRIMLRGYQRYESFKAVIDNLCNGEIQERPIAATEDAIMDFIITYGTVAPVEIQTAFDLPASGVVSILGVLLQKKRITQRPAGNGSFVSPLADPAACDPSASACRIS
jgi:predicted DsbA family dithiol-disulfide isomerase